MKSFLIKKSDLTGAWNLESFVIQDQDGLSTPWGNNCTGLLIYTEENKMSVSINKDTEDTSKIEEKNYFDSILFYSGSFRIDSIATDDSELLKNNFANSNSVIMHFVQNASNPKKIGTELLRYTGFRTTSDGNSYLTLSSASESFGRAAVRWKKHK